MIESVIKFGVLVEAMLNLLCVHFGLSLNLGELPCPVGYITFIPKLCQSSGKELQFGLHLTFTRLGQSGDAEDNQLVIQGFNFHKTWETTNLLSGPDTASPY
jgi:hypothetical protein